MKKALFLLLFLSVGQIFFPCRAEIYSFVKGKIQRNDTSYVVTHHEWPDEKVKPYSDVAKLSFEANAETYELRLQNYKDWDGGEFCIIKLYHKGNLILEFVDEETWIGEKVRERGGVTPFNEFSEEVGKHATLNDYCLIYPLENNATALLFEGYSWSSQVPLLTIIVIKDNKAEVVFNQPWSVEFFNAKPKGFGLVLIANFLQWGEGPEYDIWGADRHKLYTTPEGTMKFEKLSEEEEMCSLDFLTKGTWEFRFSTEEGPFNRDETTHIEAKYSTTTQTSILKSPERGEIVHHARYYLSKTLQSSFDKSKVGKSLRGNYICVEDTANNGVNNYEIKGYTSDILTLKLVNEKNPTYTNTFFRITENPKEAKDKIETDKVYQTAEKMPEFPGGKQRLLNWMKENIQYPVEAQKEGIQGRVIITFVINKSGKAVEPLIIQSVDPLLDKEAIRLINSMPKWKPGEEKGEPVRVKFTMPINFRLSGGRTEGTPTQEEEVLIYQYDPIADKGIGFVNSKGEIVIPGDRFSFVYESRLDKITFVLFNKELKEKGFKGIYAINRKGEPLFEVYCFDNGPDYVEEGLFRIIENNKIGFANMNGEVVIKPQFDFVWPFQECGYAVFNMGGKKVIYDTYNNYSTWEGGKWGIINKKGEIVLPPTYEEGYAGGFIIDDKRVPIEDVLESTLTN